MLPGLTEEEQKNLLLSVGTHRGKRVLTPCEVAFLFQKAINHGATLQDCAKAALLDGTTWISRFLRTLKLDKSVRHLVGWGQIAGSVSFTSATEVARLDKSEQGQVFKSIIENMLSSKEIRELVQIRLRSNRPIQECIDEVVSLRTQTVRQHMFVGSIASPTLKLKLREQTQSKRDAILRDIVLSKSAALTKSAFKLGIDNFAVITDDKGSEVFQKVLPNFEEQLNALLEAKP